MPIKTILFFLVLILTIGCKENKSEAVIPTIDSTNLDGSNLDEPTSELEVITDPENIALDTLSRILAKDGTKIDKEASKKPITTQNKTSNVLEIEGYFQYFAESMVFYPCKTKKRFKVLSNEGSRTVMEKYKTFSTEGAEKIYLRIMGEFKDFESEGGDRILIGVEIQKVLVFDPNKSCG